MKKIYRISTKDIPKVDEKISSQYQGVKKFDYELGIIKAVQIRKYDDDVVVDIEYEDKKQPPHALKRWGEGREHEII